MTPNTSNRGNLNDEFKRRRVGLAGRRRLFLGEFACLRSLRKLAFRVVTTYAGTGRATRFNAGSRRKRGPWLSPPASSTRRRP
jgi:hypothetical protein